MDSPKKENTLNRYLLILEHIFFNHYEKGVTEIEFRRDDLIHACDQLKIERPKNLGDILYSIKHRALMPNKILATQPEGMEWNIKGKGRSQYAFILEKILRIVPDKNIKVIKIPNSTPEIITKYAFSDEQALLAKIRYSRLIDVFLGITTFSLQNHLRTTVNKVGQIEIDEIYVGVDSNGEHYIIPVQAKRKKDKLSISQVEQDILCCKEKFPQLICRAISAQFMDHNLIAMFEIGRFGEEYKLINEKHYLLVKEHEIE